MSYEQVYLNKTFIASTKFSEEEVAKKVAGFLMLQPGILCVTSPEYNMNTCSPYVQNTIMNGYYPERSADVFYSMKPGWIDWIFEAAVVPPPAIYWANTMPQPEASLHKPLKN